MNRMVDRGLLVASVALLFVVLYFAFTLWTGTDQYGVIFLGLCLVISGLALIGDPKARFLGLRGKAKNGLALSLIAISIGC